jgi:hypothetical protein
MTSLIQLFPTLVVSSLLAAIASTVAPAATGAQQPTYTATPVVVTSGPRRADIARAERLEAQAELDARRVRSWREAAALHLRAARLRGQTTEALDGYRRAGWLFSAAGDHGAGWHALEQAARVALDRGDPARGIDLLVDATLIANVDGDPRQVNRLLQRTRTLIETAVVPEERRLALQARIDRASRLASR